MWPHRSWGPLGVLFRRKHTKSWLDLLGAYLESSPESEKSEKALLSPLLFSGLLYNSSGSEAENANWTFEFLLLKSESCTMRETVSRRVCSVCMVGSPLVTLLRKELSTSATPRLREFRSRVRGMELVSLRPWVSNDTTKQEQKRYKKKARAEIRWTKCKIDVRETD
jgi:hypothetical protein